MEIQFTAWDYTSEDSFERSSYVFKGSTNSGWEIFRNGAPHLQLGKGYKLLKTTACGICSTDIDRRFLPFPLPQIIGHELIAKDLESNENFAVEINDTHVARGDGLTDPFCDTGIPTHSPERKVLGIDRLPGGFGPYILAPEHGMYSVKDLPLKVAVLLEPFAAALQAVTSSPPQNGDEVAVLGPRRLGSLVLAALRAYRKFSQKQFKIYSIVRHDHLVSLSKEIGADDAIDLRKYANPEVELANRFDIVYDTTGSATAFPMALEFAKREVHLKTTNGQEMGGLKHLTALVVDELSLLPFSEENLKFHWENWKYSNKEIYVSPSAKINIPSSYNSYSDSIPKEISLLESSNWKGVLPRFDACVVSSLEEIDTCIRPIDGSEASLVRPRGAILYSGKETEPVAKFLQKGKSIRSSRCGDFELAIRILKENPDVMESLEKHMISHQFLEKDLPIAYSQAKDSNSVKVMVTHD